METHRINEDTIKVILAPEDLEDRGVSMLDLLGNRKQIENFFYSILDEVDIDSSFGKDEAVTFQVMPQTKANGLVLLISKGNKAINQMGKDIDPSSEDNFESKNWEKFFKENLGVDLQDSKAETVEEEPTGSHLTKPYTKVVRFDNFEDFVELANMLKVEEMSSTLWLYNDEYYLDLQVYTNELVFLHLKEFIAIVNEFSHKTDVTAAILSEYGKKIMDKNALQIARHYFK